MEAELETGLGLAGTSAQTEHLLFFLLDFPELWGSFREVQIHKSEQFVGGGQALGAFLQARVHRLELLIWRRIQCGSRFLKPLYMRVGECRYYNIRMKYP
jgi:hypothetical protein